MKPNYQNDVEFTNSFEKDVLETITVIKHIICFSSLSAFFLSCSSSV